MTATITRSRWRSVVPGLAGSRWRDHAACLTEDPDLFYPAGLGTASHSSSVTARQVEQAKAVCRRCPVQRECLEAAIAAGDPEGVSGGMTPTERAAYARRIAQSTTSTGGTAR